MLDHHAEVGEKFNVSGCRDFVYIPRGGTLEDYDKITSPGKNELHNWLYDHLRAKVTVRDHCCIILYSLMEQPGLHRIVLFPPAQVVNDLMFDVDVTWENQHHESFMLEVMAGETTTFNTFFSHHFVVSRREVSLPPLL